MKKSLLETKGYYENGQFTVTHVKITKKIACHKENANLKLSTGWLAKTADCDPACPTGSLDGTWSCVGGHCIFIPFG